MDMPRVTVGLGMGLVVLGVGGFVTIGGYSPTSLIPAYFGAVFVVLGLLALKQGLRKHVMHAAAGLALLALVMSGAMAFPKLPALLSGGEVERPNAVLMQAGMAVLCGLYVALGVRSFVAARRKK